ncbi:hypothetical protein WMF18_07535 [Sorangium sp. So ce315]
MLLATMLVATAGLAWPAHPAPHAKATARAIAFKAGLSLAARGR